MIKEDCEQSIYNINKYYFQMVNSKSVSIHERISFMYYEGQNSWCVYGENFKGEYIDIAILNNEQIETIKNWNVLFKSKLFRYILTTKTPNNNVQRIMYHNDIIEHFLPEVKRENKLSELLIKNNK